MSQGWRLDYESEVAAMSLAWLRRRRIEAHIAAGALFGMIAKALPESGVRRVDASALLAQLGMMEPE